MIWLLLCIVSSSAIILMFRGFRTLNIALFPAIVVNYAMAFGMGWVFFGSTYSPLDLLRMEWSQKLVMLGVLFLIIFNLMGRVAQTLGVSVSSIAAKMSMVVPITVFLITDPTDRLTLLKAVGLVAALTGVVLASLKEEQTGKLWQWLGLPVLVLLGSGVIELSLGFASDWEETQSSVGSFAASAAPFLGALMVGTVILLGRVAIGKGPSGWRWIPGGIVLGAVNFLSILALVKSLQSGVLTKSATYPVINVCIVLLSAVLSYFLFKESFSKRNLIGLALGVLAIVLLAIPAA